MKVLLSTSPHVRHGAVLQADFEPASSSMYAFAPVGLLSLTAALRQARPDVSCGIYDLNRRILSGGLPLDGRLYAAIAAELAASEAHVVGFMTECDSYHHVLQVALELKRAAPACSIVLGGPHASLVAERTLATCGGVDAIVIGEGEISFPDLLDPLREGSDAAVPGTLRRLPGGEIAGGGPRPLIASMDELPVPAYDLYRPDAGEEVFLEVGRGCPFQCRFCSTAPYWHRRHRVKSPERVVHEVRLVHELYGSGRVHFTHDLFTTDKRWVRAVCEALIAAETAVRWTCSARTDTVDQDLLCLMAKAGCDAVYFGLESGSPRILREIRKEIPLSTSFAAVEACREAGIKPNIGFIGGFPSEDATSLKDTFVAFERAIRSGCRPVHLFGYCPFIGSAMYPEPETLICTGHFVDLPLGPEADRQNRSIVRGDSELYGALFRPRHYGAFGPEAEELAGLDEFSVLVEAALYPTLALSETMGGLYQVFVAWAEWIRAHNRMRGAAEYRAAYGTPAAFAAFLRQALTGAANTRPDAVAAVEAVHLNLTVAASVARPQRTGTEMATYRSVVTPRPEAPPTWNLTTLLARERVLATLATPFDVTPILRGECPASLKRKPTFLAWQEVYDGSVRLLAVDEVIFETLQVLETGNATVGDLLLSALESRSWSAPRHADVVWASLSEAAREGLLAQQEASA